MKKETIVAAILLAVVTVIGIFAIVQGNTERTPTSVLSATEGGSSVLVNTENDAPSATMRPIPTTAKPSEEIQETEAVPQHKPTKEPTKEPTLNPTMAPTKAPTAKPTPQATESIGDINFSKQTITIAAMNGQYKTQGRCPLKSFTHPNTGKSSKALLLNYSASSISFSAYCEGTVTMELYTPGAWSEDSIYLNVLIDGNKVGSRSNYKLTGRKIHTITLATGLKKGLHTFTVERQSEVTLGSIYVNSVTLNGKLGPKPANGDYFIEFIGDSLIAGYGILYPNSSEGEYSSDPASSVYQDATKAFAYMAAKNLNADYSIVAESGIGIVSGYVSRTMSQAYAKTCPQCYDESAWSFERSADAVVLTLGTNDNVMVGRGKITYAQMKEGFKSFLLQLRAKNPSSKIVWAYGAMGYGAKDCIISVINELGGERNGYYYVGLEYNGDGGGGHPSVAANNKNANTLTEALRKILCG